MNIPEFQNEAEEAKWWADHQDEFAAEFERAATDGRLGRGTVARKGPTPGRRNAAPIANANDPHSPKT